MIIHSAVTWLLGVCPWLLTSRSVIASPYKQEETHPFRRQSIGVVSGYVIGRKISRKQGLWLPVSMLRAGTTAEGTGGVLRHYLNGYDDVLLHFTGVPGMIWGFCVPFLWLPSTPRPLADWRPGSACGHSLVHPATGSVVIATRIDPRIWQKSHCAS